jgi:uncharacterized protein YegL
MKKGLTELVFILDKSSSMGGLEKDTIGGYNSMLAKQQAVEGDAVVTTVLFDNNYELLHDRIDIKAVSPITEREYQVGGSTALLDAIGRTIYKIGNVQKNTADDYRAEKVMFVIITDGEENASREYSSDKVKAQIERQKSCYDWEFIFLGANIDAGKTAARFGIDKEKALDYVPDGAGTAVIYGALAEATVAFREAGSVDEACFEAVRADYQKRGRRK